MRLSQNCHKSTACPTCSFRQWDFAVPPSEGLGGDYVPSSNPGCLVTPSHSDFQGLVLLGGPFLGPSHLTVRKTKQPMEDNPAELPADNKHQLASHESEPWIPPGPLLTHPSWCRMERKWETFLLRKVKLHKWNTCRCEPLNVVVVC